MTDDRGQFFPVYVTAVAAALALTLALVQVGSAHVLERRAETAADAAALAAAEHWGRDLDVGIWGLGGGNGAEAAIAAGALAEENDATVVDLNATLAPLTWRVTVTVETDEGVIGGPLAGVIGEQVEDRSTARFAVSVRPLPPSPGGTSLDELARQAGVPIRSDSALRVHAGETCTTGVDTDRLSDEAKIGVMQVEDAIGAGLDLRAGYQSTACLLDAGVVIPDLSPARRGDQLTLAPDQVAAEDQLRGLGFCEVGAHTFVAPGSMVCDPGVQSLVSSTVRLVPNP